MAFDGLKKIFDMIGGATLDSSKKVGEGVQAPVNKLNDMRAKSRSGLGSRGLGSNNDSPRVLERMKMDKDEIQMFKELIDKKYERADKPKEDKSQRDAYQKASLEELLKEEDKETMDPKLIMGMGLVSFVLIMVVMIVLGFGILIGVVFGMLIFLLSIMIIFLPKLQKGKNSSEASKELPYALRQMATELRAGVGLHESMRSVALSGYGPLSEEFARTLEEIKYGETTENALLDMSERINSDGLTRAVHQITRTLSSGGDLSKTLNVIAEDVAYEMRMKLKDYAQKLNSFTMIYMFVAILGPVIFMIMLIAAATVSGTSMFPPPVLLILYLFFFPLIVGFLTFMIKRLEPQI